MYLLVDIGNTREKAAVIQADNLSSIAELSKENLQPYNIEAVYYANVSVQQRVTSLKTSLGLEHIPWRQVVTEQQAFGVTNCYQQSQLLGVDRWLGLLGAQLLYPAKNVLVVDAGTAVTLDWLGSDGQHNGGWIVPGLKLMEQAVVQNTARVFTADMMRGRLNPGTDTISCLQNGCVAAVAGVVHQAVALQRHEKIILTGGDAGYLQTYLTSLNIVVDPLLLFRGLSRYIDN